MDGGRPRAFRRVLDFKVQIRSGQPRDEWESLAGSAIPFVERPRKEPPLPLTRVSLLKGKPPEYRKAILDGLYQAMREVFWCTGGGSLHAHRRT